MCKILHYLLYAGTFIVVLLQIQTAYGKDCDPPDFFECASGDCIKRSNVCNNITDCPDNSDEGGYCEFLLCKEPKWYQCVDNISCINRSYKCDGEIDCPNGDDEKNCHKTFDMKCAKDEFECLNGSECIPITQKCDKRVDCSDGSDENPEICKNWNRTLQCYNHQFKCSNGLCLDATALCNGHNDCGDNADEKNCNTICLRSEFQCLSGECIIKSWECDGEIDCQDGSDEHENCRDVGVSPMK